MKYVRMDWETHRANAPIMMSLDEQEEAGIPFLENIPSSMDELEKALHGHRFDTEM